MDHGRWLASGKLTVCKLENGHRKFIDLPSYKMVIFHSYINLLVGIYGIICKLEICVKFVEISHKHIPVKYGNVNSDIFVGI